jgi:hypothetical protein
LEHQGALQLGQARSLLAQPLGVLGAAGQGDHGSLGRAAQNIPGQEATAGVEVQHQVMALDVRGIQHPIP